MASTRRKAAAAGLAVIGIAGLALASAAQLNVTSDRLGAGTAEVGSCDPDGVNVAYATAPGADGYAVASLTVEGIADTCAGLTMQVALDGTEIYSGTVTGTSVTISGLSADAAAVEDVAIVIFG